MNKTKHLKQFLLLLIFSVYVFSALGQQSPIKNRYNFKISSSWYHTGMRIGSNTKKTRTEKFRAEVNYGFFNIIEAGAYIGFFPSTIYKQGNGSNLIPERKTLIPNYGVQANFHILPLLIKNTNFPLDFYLSAKFGGEVFPYKSAHVKNKTHIFQMHGVAGIDFRFVKNFGLYTECGYYYSPDSKALKNLDNFMFTFGLSYKFKPKQKD